MTAVLEVSNLRKAFGGVIAVDGVSFEVRQSEILGIIGILGAKACDRLSADLDRKVVHQILFRFCAVQLR